MNIRERAISYQAFKQIEPERKYIGAYDEKDSVILMYRESKSEKCYLTIKEYPWYFCIKASELENKKTNKLIKALKKESLIQKIKEDHSYLRIYCRNLNRRSLLDGKREVLRELRAEGIKTYEADLSSSQRCLIDNKLQIEDSYQILYFDIETDDRNPGIVIGRDKILSIAFCNLQGRTYYYTGEEKDILRKSFRLIDKYDLIIGWNSGRFDCPYMQDRAREHRIWYNWKRILHVDLMQKMMEINKRNIGMIKRLRSFALNAVAKEFIGEQKIAREGVYEMFENDPDKLKRYNIQDVILVMKIDAKLKIMKQKIVEHNITGCFLNEYAISRILDIYILRSAPAGIRFQTKPDYSKDNYDKKESGYSGGVVLEPMPGLHDKVYHFDFSSLYPSIIRTWNISPETHCGERKVQSRISNEQNTFVCSPNHQLFDIKQGIIPKTVQGLLDARNQIRKVEMKGMQEDDPKYEELYFKQYAFKTMSNSFYGILGASFTRYYKKENAEAITLSGQYLIHLIVQYFKLEKMNVLAGDTDSVFVNGKEIDPEEFHQKINVFIAYHLFKEFNIINSYIDLKVEAVYENVLLMNVKKRYVKNHNGELLIVGLEARRRETIPLAAKMQTEMLEMLLLKKASQEEIISWLLDFKGQVTRQELSGEEVTAQIRLSKDCEDYDKKIYDEDDELVEVKESKLPHIKVAKWLRERKIKEDGMNTWEKGSYVKYIVTSKIRGQGINAVSPLNYKEGDYDIAYYWNTKFYAMLERILIVVFPKHDWKQYEIDTRLRKVTPKKRIRNRRRNIPFAF